MKRSTALTWPAIVFIASIVGCHAPSTESGGTSQCDSGSPFSAAATYNRGNTSLMGVPLIGNTPSRLCSGQSTPPAPASSGSIGMAGPSTAGVPNSPCPAYSCPAPNCYPPGSPPNFVGPTGTPQMYGPPSYTPPVAYPPACTPNYAVTCGVPAGSVPTFGPPGPNPPIYWNANASGAPDAGICPANGYQQVPANGPISNTFPGVPPPGYFVAAPNAACGYPTSVAPAPPSSAPQYMAASNPTTWQTASLLAPPNGASGGPNRAVPQVAWPINPADSFNPSSQVPPVADPVHPFVAPSQTIGNPRF